MPEGSFFGFDRPFTSVQPFEDSVVSELVKIFEEIPEWAKDAERCKDFVVANYEEELIRMGRQTREQSIEVAAAICFNGEDVTFAGIEPGGEGTAPGVPCDEVRLADVHTHPVGEQAYPSITDVRSSVLGITGLPNEFNQVIFRPESNPTNREGAGTCTNFHSLEARCLANQINNEHEQGITQNAQMMIQNQLIEQFGAKFIL